MGEAEDTCNDLCQYKGYAGCDAETTAGLVREPIMRRLLNGLNKSCDSFGSALLKFPAYAESAQRCHYLSNGGSGMDCDSFAWPHQPVCLCNSTTLSTTLSVASLHVGMSVAFDAVLILSRAAQFAASSCDSMMLYGPGLLRLVPLAPPSFASERLCTHQREPFDQDKGPACFRRLRQ